jgi:hypothetical protein
VPLNIKHELASAEYLESSSFFERSFKWNIKKAPNATYFGITLIERI